MRRAVCVVLLFSLTLGPHAAAASPYAVKSDPERKRNLIWPALGSFFLPGLDQFWEGQYAYGAGYTGTALLGYVYARTAFDTAADSRHIGFGLQLTLAAGGMSAFHSFRTAVETRRPHGEFEFLKTEETPADVLTAPFHFSHVTRWTTIVPLSIALGLVFVLPRAFGEVEPFDKLSIEDVFFASSTSYLAGTWEEAAFRGWLQPMAMHYIGSPFVSNVLTSGVFSAAHLGSGFIPWPQFVLGFYLGAVAIHNDWGISESIFIHSWWDMIILTAYYAAEGKVVVRLPAFQWQF